MDGGGLVLVCTYSWSNYYILLLLHELPFFTISEVHKLTAVSCTIGTHQMKWKLGAQLVHCNSLCFFTEGLRGFEGLISRI